MSGALATAVVLRGGVDGGQWVWIGAVVLALGLASIFGEGEHDRILEGLCCALAAVVVVQLVPWPERWVKWVSPASVEIWRGAGRSGWMPVGIAPAATVEEGLRLMATLAAILTARRMGWLWRDRIWVAALPVVVVAWLESALGLVQFYLSRMSGAAAGSSTGTYVNRNHYAGLLEMALPVAMGAGIWMYSRGVTRHSSSGRAAVWASAWLVMAASLLLGIVTSLSRMGFLAALGGVGMAGALAIGANEGRPGGERAWWRRWWPAAALVAGLTWVFVFLPTDELILRFAAFAQTENVTQDTRSQIWRETGDLVAAYPVLGAGLGSYEAAFQRYKSVAPENTVDFAHNDYLQVLAEMGVAGFAVACALAGYVFWRVGRVVRWERGRRNWWMAVGLLGGLAAMALHSLVDFNLYIPANALALAWLAGLAVSDGLESR
jgi:O-antigen ligase